MKDRDRQSQIDRYKQRLEDIEKQGDTDTNTKEQRQKEIETQVRGRYLDRKKEIDIDRQTNRPAGKQAETGKQR